MSNVTLKIRDVEKKWLHLLSGFCQEQFLKVNIPSHDHNHHLRVWGYAKQIFTELDSSGYNVDPKSVEGAIIAIFFHDVGLTKTLDEIGHGAESRKMCKEFFRENKLEVPKDFLKVLEAIEHHVDKKYQARVYGKKFARDDVFSVLCVADDLDAFSLTGVLRYAEIYLLRDRDISTLPLRVIKNLDSRFQNFMAVYGALKPLAKRQKQRYLTTRKFYRELQKELAL